MQSETTTQLSVVPGDLPAKDNQGVIPSEIPEAPAKLSANEKKIWEHVTNALYEYGLIHRTDGLLLTVVCKTFLRYVEAEEQLSKVMKKNDGHYMVKTPNGYDQPHQMYYVARNLKKELLQWLPEAALTIPSFHKIVSDRLVPNQGSLFEDPVEAHKRRGTAVRMRDASK